MTLTLEANDLDDSVILSASVVDDQGTEYATLGAATILNVNTGLFERDITVRFNNWPSDPDTDTLMVTFTAQDGRGAKTVKKVLIVMCACRNQGQCDESSTRVSGFRV